MSVWMLSVDNSKSRNSNFTSKMQCFCFVFLKNKEYTVYVLDKTKSVSASQDKDSLTVKMPENSYAADDRITAGYILTVGDDEGNLFSYEIGP